MRFCRLCGADTLTPLTVDAGGNQWHRCQGCGCDQSEAASRPPTRPPSALLERTPTPLRLLVELHAAGRIGDVVQLRTRVTVENPADRTDDSPYRPENLHVLSPGFVRKVVTELGFKVLSLTQGPYSQHWRLQKVDGL